MLDGDHSAVYDVITHQYPSLRRNVFDLTSLLDEKTRGFVGRDFVFESIENFIQRHSNGYLRIIADDGLGKTAVAAIVAQRYHATVHFCSIAWALAALNGG